jgi:hypothetical protein
VTRRFADVTGALQDMGRYEARLGDIGLDRTLPLIGPSERESLALAIYLRDQLDEVQANDYSASIIHVSKSSKGTMASSVPWMITTGLPCR